MPGAIKQLLLDKIKPSSELFYSSSSSPTLLSSLLSLKRLLLTLRARYLSPNNSKSRANSNLLILETNGTISSILKSWIILIAFRKRFTLKILRKRPTVWTILSNSSRNATGRSQLLILQKPVGLLLSITRATLLL